MNIARINKSYKLQYYITKLYFLAETNEDADCYSMVCSDSIFLDKDIWINGC